ncbi:MAG: amidophosphoribosyltransferase [Alphaproteobacteria bacterium]|jgi:amidophosphoribosyltransferase|nr:amidophosphoribosyltransferase [Thalassospira sp.]MCE2964374.1 amidophosphoribosyltransferase [Alphaproteobacteria bacterium]
MVDFFPSASRFGDADKPREECGVFGIIGCETAASHTALGLHALQHRGQEAVGIVTTDGDRFFAERALGLVGDTFADSTVLARLKGSAAIGHVRYATTGETILRNVQPLFAELAFGGFAIAHNGNLTNALKLRQQLIDNGSLFQATTDTEVIIHLMARAQNASTVVERLIAALKQVTGAYSLICLTKDSVIGVRDPAGVRPLVLGRLDGKPVLASETCGLDIIGATLERDISPGELIVLHTDGRVESFFPFDAVASRFCVFEYIYFARPDSDLNEKSVYAVRRRIGMELAHEAGINADVVIPVPDSGVPAAIGYAQAANLPFELGIIRNHYVGRTFIEPTDQIRHLGVKLKHNPNRAELKDKRVILVDDSIVRGTTSVKIVDMVRQAGAKEVHLRIASPPTINPCFYGIDTPSKEKLLASNHTLEEMRKYIGVDSLAFLSVDGLYRAVGEAKRNKEMPQYCDACFTGDYPLPLVDMTPEQKGKKRKALLHC